MFHKIKDRGCRIIFGVMLVVMLMIYKTGLSWLMLVYYLWTFAAAAEEMSQERCFKSALFKKIPLVQLTGTTTSASYQKETVLDCQVRCSMSQGCKSINVKERDDGYFDCDLLEHNKDSSGITMTSSHGYIHYEVSIAF